MSRYIDAIPFAQAVSDLRNKEREEYDNLVGKHRSLARSIHGQHVEFCEKMLKAIREQPTVDAVPVTRCIDCKHSTKVEGMIGLVWCDHLADGGTWVENDWFCADGERRTER